MQKIKRVNYILLIFEFHLILKNDFLTKYINIFNSAYPISKYNTIGNIFVPLCVSIKYAIGNPIMLPRNTISNNQTA